MIPEFPTTRSETFLAAILGETVELPEPQSRMELYLAKVAGVDVEVPEPQTRSELFLAAILGESVELPAPRSRVEFCLAKIAGLDVETPEPQTRIDEYLAEWAENGSGWSWETVTGISPLALASAAAHSIKSLIQYGKCVTSGGDIYCNNGKLVAEDNELPAGYKRVLGFSMNNNAYWKITDFPLYGSDALRFSFEATDACNIIGAYSGSASGNNYSLYAAASSNYLRYKNGAYNSAIDFNTRYDVEISPTGSHGMKTDSTWTAQEFTTPTDLCIGTTSTSASSAKLKGKMYGNVEVVGRAKFIPCERVSDSVLGYYDVIGEAFYEQASSYAGAASLGYDHSHETVLSVVGTPEVITLGEQIATAVDLFATDDVADEQDIISGVVTRRVEVTITGGAITITPLATPVIEHVTPQPLSTVEGDNTLSWTAEVSGTVKEVEYAYVAPSFEWKTASGAVVSVNDAIAGEVGALTVGINPVQNFNGYDKPWPPGGGVNLTDYSTPYVGEIGVTKQVVLFDLTLSAGTYTFSAKQSVEIPTSVRNCLIYSVTGGTSWTNETAAQNFNPADLRHKLTFTLAETTAVKFGYWNRNPSVSATFTEWQVEAGESFTAFAPYSNICPITGHSTVDVWVEATYDPTADPTVTVPIGGTYYGGTLDVLTGVLTVTWGTATLDGTQTIKIANWRPYAGTSAWLYDQSGFVGIIKNKLQGSAISDTVNTNTYGNVYNGQTGVSPTDTDAYSLAIRIPVEGLTTGALINAYLAEHPIQVVYKLATPQTVQLTPAQVSTLLGTNVIWASGNGEVSVTYRAEVNE